MKIFKVILFRMLAGYQLTMLNSVHEKLQKLPPKEQGIKHCIEAFRRAAKFMRYSDWLYENDSKFPRNGYPELRASVYEEIQTIERVLQKMGG